MKSFEFTFSRYGLIKFKSLLTLVRSCWVWERKFFPALQVAKMIRSFMLIFLALLVDVAAEQRKYKIFLL